MTEDEQQELIAMVAAARSIQGAAEKAVADLSRVIADNRAVPGQIAQEGAKARQNIQATGEQALVRISQGAEKAIREAAVNDVGAKIEAAIAGPLLTIDQALANLKSSASTAELAADRWRLFTRIFRWQQLAIAVVAGILLGAVGHWYFVTRGPETEAAEYLLSLKRGIEQKAAQTPASSGNIPKTQKSMPFPKPKPKPQSRSEAVPMPAAETAPGTPPVPETIDPPQ